MSRPAKVKIGHITYAVEYLDMGSKMFGCTEPVATLIQINSAKSDSMQRATLWHEVMHAACNVYGPHRGESLHHYVKAGRRHQPTIEELYVGILEVGTLMFVRDNPSAWSWICGKP